MNVSIIGTGNMAYHMVRALGRHESLTIAAICGTSAANARSIRTWSGTLCMADLSLVPACELVLLCVPDSQIATVSAGLAANSSLSDSLIAHTSGSVSSEVLRHHSSYGVFYPLQTFTKGQRMGYRSIPVCITGNSPVVRGTLTEVAAIVTRDVRHLTDEQRASVHLSAVVVNNLTNHLIHLATQRLEDQRIASDILYPLIHETVAKLQQVSPLQAQTGPARRTDHTTIEQHLSALSGNPQLAAIYKVITESIVQTYNK